MVAVVARDIVIGASGRGKDSRAGQIGLSYRDPLPGSSGTKSPQVFCIITFLLAIITIFYEP